VRAAGAAAGADRAVLLLRTRQVSTCRRRELVELHAISPGAPSYGRQQSV
jgi:hypothetical protein